MAPHPLVVATCASVLLLSGCSIDGLDPASKTCPCAPGWSCDTAINRCLRAAPAADGGGDAFDGGRADGGRDDHETFLVECEDGVLTGQMEVLEDDDASGGRAVHAAEGTPPWTSMGWDLPPHRVTFPLRLQRGGTYHVWIRMKGFNLDEDTFYLGFNPEDLRRIYPAPVYLDSYVWLHGVPAEPEALRFDDVPRGDQGLMVGHTESGVRCDRVLVTTDPELVP